MRRQENVVEAAHQLVVAVEDPVREDPEHLFRQGIFGDAVVVVESGLCAPANVEHGKHVVFGPVQDIGQFGPIVHFFEGQQFHRRAGDDEAVELLAAHLREGFVMGDQVFGGDIL